MEAVTKEALLTEKNELLEQMLENARGQAALLEEEDIATLELQLELQQEWIEEIDKIDRRIAQFASGVDTPRALELISQARAMLAEMVDLDTQHRRKAQLLLATYSDEVRKQRQAQQGLSAYAKPTDFTGGVYFDKNN